MLAVEAWNGRTAWSKHEPELSLDCAYEAAEDLPAEKPLFTHGFSERYAVRSVATGVGVAAAMSALTQGLASAATAMLVSIPKPMRASREAFGCALTRGMASSHDALVIRPRALRAARPGRRRGGRPADVVQRRTDRQPGPWSSKRWPYEGVGGRTCGAGGEWSRARLARSFHHHRRRAVPVRH